MRLVIGSDHAGWPLKRDVLAHVRALGHVVIDVGSFDDKPVDFPDIARALVTRIRSGEAERGLMVEHDDVNVMCLGAQIVGPWLAKDLIAAFLAAVFANNEDLRRRVAKLHAMETEA